jgi:hypothetical protein
MLRNFSNPNIARNILQNTVFKKQSRKKNFKSREQNTKRQNKKYFIALFFHSENNVQVFVKIFKLFARKWYGKSQK